MNILRKRLDNRKKNIFGDSRIKFTFKNNIRSIDIPNIYFNNYFKGNDDYYEFFKKECNKIINGNIDIDSYNIKSINRTVKIEERINTIYRETYGYSYTLPYLHRITKVGNERFQLVYTDKENEIIIIDLYHLLIPAVDHTHGEVVRNPKLHYEEVKNNKYDLCNAIKQLKRQP